jgi:hypothetical protein
MRTDDLLLADELNCPEDVFWSLLSRYVSPEIAERLLVAGVFSLRALRKAPADWLRDRGLRLIDLAVLRGFFDKLGFSTAGDWPEPVFEEAIKFKRTKRMTIRQVADRKARGRPQPQEEADYATDPV